MAPAVLRRIAGRTVRTVVGCNSIALFVTIHRRYQPRIQSKAVSGTGHIVHLDTITQLKAAAVCQVGFIAVHIPHLVNVVLMSCHHADGVVSKLLVVLQQLLRRDSQHVVILLQNTTNPLSITIILVRKLAAFLVHVVNTGIHRELQAIVQLKLQRTFGV